VVNDFTDPNLVLDQNPFIAQVNTLYTNTKVTRANQLWIRGFVNASSQLLFSRIFAAGCVKTADLLRTVKGGTGRADPSGS